MKAPCNEGTVHDASAAMIAKTRRVAKAWRNLPPHAWYRADRQAMAKCRKRDRLIAIRRSRNGRAACAGSLQMARSARY